MSVNEFLELLIKELESNHELCHYYRILDSKSSFLFRKAYLEQRLQFVDKSITKTNNIIWDTGCGYATTSIFLSLNGYNVIGTTLEYYYDKIQTRLDYWSKFGDLSALKIKYENLFDAKYDPGTFDAIILQDTLHHIEPISDAVDILYKALKDDGKIIISEENGNNIVCNIKHFKERGFKRIAEIYDERLNKKIMFGNENTRSLKKWIKIFSDNNFSIDNKNTEYIRLFPPVFFNDKNYAKLINTEQKIWKKNSIVREFLFFGINFLAHKGKIQ